MKEINPPAEHRKKWTDEDVEYLREKWGEMRCARIAKNLNRTITAVQGKACKLGLGGTIENSSYITATELANTLSTCPKQVISWAKHDNLKATKKILTHKKSYWLIKIEDFWRWAEVNQEKINAFKINKNMLGIEPEWLQEKRKEDFKTRRMNERYTKKEDDFIIANYKTMTYAEMGEIIGRNRDSVKFRVHRIISKKKVIKLPWTDKEVKILVTLRNAGKTFSYIADKLGRSKSSVSWKYRHVLDKEGGVNRYI